jgi:hypothetical protein
MPTPLQKNMRYNQRDLACASPPPLKGGQHMPIPHPRSHRKHEMSQGSLAHMPT